MATQPSMTNRMIPPGIAADVAAERNYRSIQSERQLAAYDHQLTTRQQQIPGMLFPVYRLGEPYTYVLRPERPRLGYDGKTIKYEWPERVPLCLDVLPRYRVALGNITIPIWITEGAKKADALASAFGASIVPINLNGVWGWKQRGHDGASHPLEDLDHIAWAGRQVVLAFDNDVTRKAEVQDALKALRRHLSSRGAVVDVLYLPDTGEKLGIDDAFAGGMSSEQLQRYISTSPDQVPPECSAGDLAELDTLTPDDLRRRYLVVLAERDRLKAENVQLRLELGDVKARNRFETQASGAENIGAASKRLTFMELKKEIDTAAGDRRKIDDWYKVRPAYMAKCKGLSASTVSRHLDTFQKAGIIEKQVRSSFDPNTGSWCSEMLIRPLVDLSDPSQVNIPTTHGGKRERCPECHSENVAIKRVKVCRDCGTMLSEPTYTPVNPPELHDAIQAPEAALVDAAAPDGANCRMHAYKKTVVPSTELQDAIHSPDANPRQKIDRSPVQSAAELAPEVDASSLSKNGTNRHTTAPIPVQTGDPVTALQEPLQAPQDAPSAADALITPCTPDHPMHAPAAAPLVEPSWKPETLMVTATAAAPGNMPCVQEYPMRSPADADILISPWKHDHPMEACAGGAVTATPNGSPAAVCSPLPAGLTAIPVEAIEPSPAAALTPDTAPGVASGKIAADDPWWAVYALHAARSCSGDGLA